MTLSELRNEYRPYDSMPAFDEGFADYQLSNTSFGARYHGVAGQAWDRGYECAMRWARYLRNKPELLRDKFTAAGAVRNKVAKASGRTKRPFLIED